MGNMSPHFRSGVVFIIILSLLLLLTMRPVDGSWDHWWTYDGISGKGLKHKTTIIPFPDPSIPLSPACDTRSPICDSDFWEETEIMLLFS